MTIAEIRPGDITEASAPSIAFCLFSALQATQPHARVMPWDELVVHLTHHQVRTEKDGPGWSPACYAPGATRGKAGILAVTALVLDVDHQEPMWSLLYGLEYAAHTTWKHHAGDPHPDCGGRHDCPHWRIVLPLAHPVSGDEWDSFRAAARFWLCPNADEGAKDGPRFFWLPTAQPGAPTDIQWQHGRWLDPDELRPVPVEHPSPSRHDEPAPAGGGSERPGDRYERETSWRELLPGWTEIGLHGDNLYLRRPGKSGGWSATISQRGEGVLYVFTSSAAPFVAGECYSRFGAYALLEHGGDFKAATKALGERYGGGKRRASAAPAGPPSAPGDGESPAGDDGDGLPQINASNQDLRVITAETWDAVRQANDADPFLFRHGGLPVRIERDDEARPILRELTVDHVRHVLARVAEFVQFTKDGDSWRSRIVLPPGHVCRDVLVTPDPPLPVVTRVTECPVFGPDGALQTVSGYHAASRTYLAIPPDVEIPHVPDAPSDEEVARARTLILDDVLGDFPFVSEADRANIVALGLEPFVRGMISGPQPMHGVEASTPGSGKGLLVEAVLRPSCGRNIAAFPQAKDDDEWRKRLTSTFERGYPAVLIDNVNRPLESGSLAMALTIGIWTDRVLGTSKTISVPVRCSWVLTANNPTYSTEMARRTVRSRIDPKVDRPQERGGWRHTELLAWIDEHRGELIWAYCVLGRSWIAAGRPAFTGKALGSYERWSHVLGGILEHVGIVGFLANQSDFYELADLEAGAWRAFVEAWWEKHQRNEVGTAELFSLAVELDGFDLGSGNERAQKTRFGRLLSAQRDRVIGDYRVTPTRTVQRAQRWCLLPIQGSEGVNLVNLSEPFLPLLHAGTCACTGACVCAGIETFTEVHKVHSSDNEELSEIETRMERPPVWRCPKCRAMERVERDDGVSRCAGCGLESEPTGAAAAPRRLCEFCRRAPAIEGATGCSDCEGR